jgi:hypothetical protein
METRILAGFLRDNIGKNLNIRMGEYIKDCTIIDISPDNKLILLRWYDDKNNDWVTKWDKCEICNNATVSGLIDIIGYD